MDIFLYFSKIFGTRVVDAQDEYVGTLCDIAMGVTEETYPKAVALTVKKGFITRKFAEIEWKEIKELGEVIKLSVDAKKISFQKTKPKFDLSLRIDILDQQVVDTNHQKVVRVNDIHLLRVDNQLHLAHVEVGVRGLVRRLGWTRFLDSIVKMVSPKSAYLSREDLIPWKNTQVLTVGRTKNILRLDIARKKLAQIPPTELAEIMEDLDIFEKHSLFKSLEATLQRKVFSDMAISEQEELVDQLEDKEAVELIEDIPSDDAVDLLMKLPKSKTHQLMRLMETDDSKRLRKLLGFAEDSAGGLMTTEYLSLSGEARVKDALQKIKDNVNYPGNLYHIYIVDEKNRLLGITALRRFINESPDKSLIDTCYPKSVFVRTDDGMEEIALLLEKYKYSVVPVVNEENVLQGVITIDDVMEGLIEMVWSKYKEKL